MPSNRRTGAHSVRDPALRCAQAARHEQRRSLRAIPDPAPPAASATRGRQKLSEGPAPGPLKSPPTSLAPSAEDRKGHRGSPASSARASLSRFKTTQGAQRGEIGSEAVDQRLRRIGAPLARGRRGATKLVSRRWKGSVRGSAPEYHALERHRFIRGRRCAGTRRGRRRNPRIGALRAPPDARGSGAPRIEVGGDGAVGDACREGRAERPLLSTDHHAS